MRGCDLGQLTIAYGRTWECRGGHWVGIVGQVGPDALANAGVGAPVWVDATVVGMLVAAGVAVVALVRLAKLDWIEAKRRRENEQPNKY